MKTRDSTCDVRTVLPRYQGRGSVLVSYVAWRMSRPCLSSLNSSYLKADVLTVMAYRTAPDGLILLMPSNVYCFLILFMALLLEQKISVRCCWMYGFDTQT
jgi:hypothetical protein